MKLPLYQRPMSSLRISSSVKSFAIQRLPPDRPADSFEKRFGYTVSTSLVRSSVSSCRQMSTPSFVTARSGST